MKSLQMLFNGNNHRIPKKKKKYKRYKKKIELNLKKK